MAAAEVQTLARGNICVFHGYAKMERDAPNDRLDAALEKYQLSISEMLAKTIDQMEATQTRVHKESTESIMDKMSEKQDVMMKELKKKH